MKYIKNELHHSSIHMDTYMDTYVSYVFEGFQKLISRLTNELQYLHGLILDDLRVTTSTLGNLHILTGTPPV
jgi:hypothetical protein